MFLTSRDSRNLLLFGKEIEIRHKLKISGDLLTILLKKYTETVGGPGAPGVSEDKEDLRPRRRASPVQLAKLLNYMAILCLFAEENWQVDVFYLKDDLGLQTRAYAYHPSILSCVIQANISGESVFFKFFRTLGVRSEKFLRFKRRHSEYQSRRLKCTG